MTGWVIFDMSATFPDGKYFFAVNSIPQTFGGLTSAMLNRARLFWEHARQRADILTFQYNPDFPQIRDTLYRNGKLPDSVSVYNLYEYFRAQAATATPGKAMPSSAHLGMEEPGFVADKAPNKEAYRYYRNGLYIMYKSFERPDKQLKFIDYFNENRNRTRRDEYDAAGRIHRIIYMDLVHNVPRQELYFTEAGYCYLSKWFRYDEEKAELEVERVNLFPPNEGVVAFTNEPALQTYWLDLLVGSDQTFIVVDGRALDPLILDYERPNVYNVFMTHSTHLRPPFEHYSTLRLGNRPVFSNLAKPDAVVFLTKGQLHDVQLQFGQRDNLFVIPHAYDAPSELPSFDQRDLNKVVVMARYHEEKQLDHVIRAFATVASAVPNATLHMFGFGPEENNLRTLIRQLGLDSRVHLLGFTKDPKREYETAAFSVFTSKYEGFGLSVLESLAHGCPVVSYDLKYGPSDMIDDGKNGFLVENLNIDQLAQRMIQLLKNPDLLQGMSRQAWEKAGEFREATFVERWASMFQSLVANRPLRAHLTNMEFELLESDWKTGLLGIKSKSVYHVKGVMQLSGTAPQTPEASFVVSWRIYDRETRNSFVLPASAKLTQPLTWEVSGEFDVETMYHGKPLPVGTWDVSLFVQWHNAYFEKRIGYRKAEAAASEKKRHKSSHQICVQPYYTNPHGNLSFHVSEE